MHDIHDYHRTVFPTRTEADLLVETLNKGDDWHYRVAPYGAGTRAGFIILVFDADYHFLGTL